MKTSLPSCKVATLAGITSAVFAFLATVPAMANLALWTGTNGVSATTNWSDSANWLNIGAGGAGPNLNDAMFGGSTSVGTAGLINNVVDTSQTPLSLNYTNGSGQFHTTLIPAGVTLSVGSGGFTNGGVNVDAYNTSCSIVGGGTLLVNGGNFTVGNNGPSAGGSTGTLDLSALSNFVYTSSSGIFGVGSTGNRSLGVLVLAGASNSVTAATVNLETSASSSSVSTTSYLGTGTNILNANTINLGAQRSSATLRWTNDTGGLRVRGTGGTDNDRATMVLGNRNAGGTSGTANGNLWVTNHPVDMRVGTLTLGQCNQASPVAGRGNFQFDQGTVDVTTINMGICSGTGTASGTLNVGTNAATGAPAQMNIGNGGVSLVNLTAAGTASGDFNIFGGSVICSNNIVKTSSTGTGNVTINSLGSLNMVSGTIGTTARPIDTLSLSDATLILGNLSFATTNAVATTLTIGGDTNTISVGFLPAITSVPTNIFLIKYVNPPGAFNVGLSNLADIYTGYVTNDTTLNAITLVITDAHIAQGLTWTGSGSALWNKTDLDWTNSAGTAVKYFDTDLVTFSDASSVNSIGLPLNVQPGGITVNNPTKNYTLTGNGSIVGSGNLTKQGAGTLLLDNSGANTFSGAISISGGAVQVGNNDNNGSLGNGAISLTAPGALTFNQTNNYGLLNVLSGGGTLNQNGSNILTVSGSSLSYTGAVNVAQGTLKLGNVFAVGSTNAGVTISSGATLDFNGVGPTNVPVVVSGWGVSSNGAIINSGASVFPAVSHVTLAGDTAIGGPGARGISGTLQGRWDIRATSSGSSDPALTKLSTTGHAYNLIKVGSNYVGICNATIDTALGDVDIQAGTLSLQANDTGLGNPANTLTVRAGATLDLFALTNQLNKVIVLNGDGVTTNLSVNSGVNTVIGPVTLNGANICSAGGTSLALNGPIGGTGSLTKVSSALLTLGGANNYNGSTIVNGGTLGINGINSGGGLVTNAFGTTLTGTGTNTGPVNVNGTLNPGAVTVAGTFTAGGGLTLSSGSTPTFDLHAVNTVGGGVNDLLQITGDLTANNTNAFAINMLDGFLRAGTYQLITFTGNLLGTMNTNVALVGGGATRFTMAIATNTPHQVNLVVVGSGANIKWVSTTDNNWTIGTLTDWQNTNTLALTSFFQGDEVLFDDSVVGVQTSLLLNTNAAPDTITVNTANGYAVGGGGKITGAADLLKTGSGDLTLYTTNDFLGTVTVQGGTLVAANAAALGATNGPTLVSSGATLDVFAQNLGFEYVTASGQGVTNGGAIVNNSTTNQTQALRNVTLAGNTTFGGIGRWDIRGSPATLLTSPTNSVYNITKVGANQVSLVAVGSIDPSLRDIDVQQGIFAIQTSTIQVGDPAGTITVHTGATLDIYALSAGPLNKNLVFQDGATWFNENSACTNAGLANLQGMVTFNVASAGTTPSLTCTNVISGVGGITKTGAGALNLVAANTYSSNTIVNAGTLALLGSGSINNSPNITLGGGTLDVTGRSDSRLTLAAGQTLAGNGTVWGDVTAGAGTTLKPGSAANLFLIITNNLLLNGSSNVFVVSTGIGDCQIAVSNNLTLSGLTTLFIAPASVMSLGQRAVIITYGGALVGDASNLQVLGAPGFAFSLDLSTTNVIKVTATEVPIDTYWRGWVTGAPTLWDTTTTNWTQDFSTPTNFLNGQVAHFDASGNPNVALVGALSPLGITVDSNPQTYTLGGAGHLTGGGSMTVQNGAGVILDNSGSNDNSGLTILINNAYLQVGNGDTRGNLGSGSISNADTSMLAFDRTDNVNVPNFIFGTGSVSNFGTGVLTLSGNNAIAGVVGVAAGTLKVNHNNALGGINAPNPSMFVNTNATLDLGGASFAANSLNLSNEYVSVVGPGVGGKGAIINSSTNTQQNALRYVTLTGDTTFGGTGRWDIRNTINSGLAVRADAFLDTVSQPFNLTKVGSNFVGLVGVLIDTSQGASIANIYIQGGILSFEHASTMGDPTGTAYVTNGATISFFATGTTNPLNKFLVLNGDGVTPSITNGSGNDVFIGQVTLNSNCVLNIGTGTTLTISNNVVDGTQSGSLIKDGGGRLTLAGTNTYTGPTVVTNGQLQFQGTNVPNSPLFNISGSAGILDLTKAGGVLSLGSGQTLSGKGTVWASVTNGPGSFIAPGNSIGTLTISTNLVLQGTAVMEIDKSQTSSNDMIVSPNIALGGTLTVVTNPAAPLAGGDSFKLFSATVYSGQFAVTNLPNIGPGLAWDATNLNSSGILRVLSLAPPPAPPAPGISNFLVSAGNFILRGAATNSLANKTYYVLASTNVTLARTNWTILSTNLFDGSGGFSATNAIDSTQRARFYLIEVPWPQ